jgi:predicted RNA binding protein YcfA (HicA-like mRNA interferase family)
VVQSWMLDLFENSPPPYRGSADILSGPPSLFDDAENELIARVKEATINPSRPFPSDFSNVTNLTRSLFNIKQSIWSIVPVDREPFLPTIPGALPLATDKLERFIVKQGWEKVPGGGKGSHAKYRDTSGRMIVLPHSKDVSRIVLSNTAQTLGVRANRLVQLAR